MFDNGVAGWRVDDPDSWQPRALMLFAPSCGGKDSIIQKLELRGLVMACVRDTTREKRPGDNGHYRHISLEEFLAHQAAGDYVLDHPFADWYFGVPRRELRRAWNVGMTAVLKGGIEDVARAKRQISQICPSARVTVVQVVTDPPDKWEQIVYAERPAHEAAKRVEESRRALELALGEHRRHVDAIIINRWGELDRTVEQIAGLLQES